jgi:hypothetical protein
MKLVREHLNEEWADDQPWNKAYDYAVKLIRSGDAQSINEVLAKVQLEFGYDDDTEDAIYAAWEDNKHYII